MKYGHFHAVFRPPLFLPGSHSALYSGVVNAFTLAPGEGESSVGRRIDADTDDGDDDVGDWF